MPITAGPSAPARKATKASGATTPSTSLAVNTAPLHGRSKDRAEGLTGWFQMGQLGCIAKGWLADAGAIGIHGEKIAEGAARTAESVEPVGKILDVLAMSGPYAALLGAVLPFVTQILMNHKVIPETAMLEGVVPPAMLEAQVSAQLAQVQMEAIQAQKAAEAKLAELKAMQNGSTES